MKHWKELIKPATAHVLMVSFVLGGVGALQIGLQQSLKAAEASLRPELRAVVLLQSGVTDGEAERWVGTLMSLDPEIESVTYISRAEALQKAQANPALSKSLLMITDNPFPPSVVVYFKDIAWMERPEPGLLLKSEPFIQEIRWNAEARSVFRSIRQWRMWIMRLSAFAMILLSVWCFFGLYRFLALKAPLSELLTQLGLGFIGGSLAVATWGFSLQGLGMDAALYRPESISFWPLITAIMAALATFGWRVTDEA